MRDSGLFGLCAKFKEVMETASEVDMMVRVDRRCSCFRQLPMSSETAEEVFSTHLLGTQTPWISLSSMPPSRSVPLYEEDLRTS